MSKEAMKLALEALETERDNYQDWDKEDGAPEYIYEAITALREALAEQPAQEKDQSVMYTYPSKPEPIPCGKPMGILMKQKGDEHMKLYPLAEQPAQQALDKKAENARELGLDYEPVWGGGPSNKDYEDAMRLRRLNELAKPAQQQEPVAWRFTGIAGLKRYMTQKQYDAQQPGVKKWYEPFMCANCTSLLAQRKPLTDDEIHQCFLASEQGQDGTEFRKAFARAIEAAHGIKGEA